MMAVIIGVHSTTTQVESTPQSNTRLKAYIKDVNSQNGHSPLRLINHQGKQIFACSFVWSSASEIYLGSQTLLVVIPGGIAAVNHGNKQVITTPRICCYTDGGVGLKNRDAASNLVGRQLG